MSEHSAEWRRSCGVWIFPAVFCLGSIYVLTAPFVWNSSMRTQYGYTITDGSGARYIPGAISMPAPWAETLYAPLHIVCRVPVLGSLFEGYVEFVDGL